MISRDGLDGEKECPRCSTGMMYLQTEVEHDEAPYGDPDDGDWEMGQTCTLFYECDNKDCRYVEIIDQEFKGSGELR